MVSIESKIIIKHKVANKKDIQCINRLEIKKLWQDTEELTNQRICSPMSWDVAEYKVLLIVKPVSTWIG